MNKSGDKNVLILKRYTESNVGTPEEDERKDNDDEEETRPDTRLPKSRAGGQGPYLRSLDHLGRSSEAKEIKS